MPIETEKRVDSLVPKEGGNTWMTATGAVDTGDLRVCERERYLTEQEPPKNEAKSNLAAPGPSQSQFGLIYRPRTCRRLHVSLLIFLSPLEADDLADIIVIPVFLTRHRSRRRYLSMLCTLIQ